MWPLSGARVAAANVGSGSVAGLHQQELGAADLPVRLTVHEAAVRLHLVPATSGLPRMART
jgi:hypothetical protein